MACVDAMKFWHLFIIGIAMGFLVANVILSILSIIFFRCIREAFRSKPLSSDHPPTDTFIEAIERYSSSSKLKQSKSEPNSPLTDLDSWAKEMQRQAENGHNEISSEIDDGPGEISLFAEDYVTESEHNRALASLDKQIGGLIKKISKRDQYLQESRAETIEAETFIHGLQEEVKSLKADQAKEKIIMEDLQHTIDEKKKLILELREQVSNFTHGVSEDEEVDSSHSIDQEKPPLIEQQETTPIEHEEATPIEQQETTPIQQQEATPIGQQEATPIEQQEATPTGQQEATPIKQQEATSIKQQEATPIKQQEATPIKQKEANLIKQQEATSIKRQEATPIKQQEATSIKQQEATLIKQQEATSIKQQEATPIKQQDVTPIKQQKATLIEQQEATPIKHQEATPIEQQEATPIKHQEATPIEQQEATPIKQHEATPIEQEEATPIEQEESTESEGKPKAEDIIA